MKKNNNTESLIFIAIVIGFFVYLFSIPFIKTKKQLYFDNRSYFYDPSLYTYRPFVDTSEVNKYFNLPKYRKGNFYIVVNTGGVLKEGRIIGGENSVWSYDEGVNDDDLILIDGPIEKSKKLAE